MELAFASPENDGVVFEGGSNGREFARAFLKRDGIVAAGGNTQIATPIEVFLSAGKIESSKVFARLGERDM